MPTLDTRLALLRREPVATARDILIASLPNARTDERGRLCLDLARDPHPHALHALISHFHRLHSDDAEAVAAAIPDLRPAANLILQDPDPQARSNLVGLVAIRSDARAAAACLVPALQRDDPDLAEQAADAVLAVVVEAVGTRGRRRVSDARRAMLERLVIDALESGRGRRSDSVLVAGGLLTVRPGPTLADLLEQPGHPAVFALRGVTERLTRSLVRRNLLSWLGVEVLRSSAARWVSQTDGLEAWSDLLSGGHLILSPRRRGPLRQVDRPVRCQPSLTVAAALPPTAQARLPGLIAALDLSADLRVCRLADLVALPSPVARWQTLMTLMRQHAPRAARAIEPFCFDRRGFIARLATRHLLTQPGGPGQRTLIALRDCGHVWVADCARRELASDSASSFFASWLELSNEVRVAALHRAAARFPDELRHGLADALETGSRRHRLLALDVIRRLRIVPQLEELIITLAAGPDARVASAAVAALADGRSPGRAAAVRTALGHADARVRANAIEVLARTGVADAIELVRPLTRSPDNRPRANAVRALLRARTTDAEIELKTLLTDENPLHRISGLWVARRARPAAVHVEVKRLAEDDQLPEVRGRASAVMRFLLARTPIATAFVQEQDA